MMREKSIIPVLALSDSEQAFAIAEVALRHGFSALEITLRTEQGLAIIAALKKHYGDELTVLCGTIVTPGQVADALQAGADYLVSPGVSPKLLPSIIKHKDIFFAGITTISEAMQLYENGIPHAKLFPAELIGGIKFLKSIEVLLPQMKFFPTGGIRQNNAKEYLQCDNVLHVGGTWFTADGTTAAAMEKHFIAAKDIVG